MSECFIGEIRMFAGNYNPEDWVLCNGQSLNLQQNQALYSLIGVTYGGDNVNTFNVPDLRGRVPVGQGTNTTANPPLSARTIGQSFGEETHTVTEGEMPAHTHPIYAGTGNASSQVPGPTMVYATVQPNTTANVTGLYTAVPSSTLPSATMDAKAVTYAGGSQAHNNMMFTTAISFIMAILGQYPQRPN